MRGAGYCLLLLAAAPLVTAEEFQELQKKVSEFTLGNGMRFVVLERRESPVVSFHTVVNAGSVQDPAGQTGIAHMFEHMAFKGTETIGTRNWAGEKKELDAVEEAYDRLQAEVEKGIKADQAQVDMLRGQLRVAIDNAQRYGSPVDYVRTMVENGGTNIGVASSSSTTEFAYSLPSNRVELWFLMESQRLSHPAFRDFYQERDVVAAEYRQRVESNVRGRLLSELAAGAFQAHPYGRPQLGWPSDVANLRRSQAQAFFERYYVPGNVTVAMVGDITGVEAKRLAERYFGPMAGKPMPPAVTTEEPAQMGPRTAVLESTTGQPVTAIGFKRPSEYDKDDLAFDLLQIALSEGKSGLLYDELVRDRRIAQQVGAMASFPDGRFPCLFVIQLTPAQGHTVEENQRALEELLERLKAAPMNADLLERAKVQGRANLVRRITSNRELATMLAFHTAHYGDWRKLFASLDAVKRVKPEDVQRVVSRYLVASGRTTVSVGPPGQANRQAAGTASERKAGGLQ